MRHTHLTFDFLTVFDPCTILLNPCHGLDFNKPTYLARVLPRINEMCPKRDQNIIFVSQSGLQMGRKRKKINEPIFEKALSRNKGKIYFSNIFAPKYMILVHCGSSAAAWLVGR